MDRKEALATVDSVDYFGMNTSHKVELSKAFINKIYDDFENQVCETCELYDGKYCIEFSIFVPKTHGCRKWRQDNA